MKESLISLKLKWKRLLMSNQSSFKLFCREKWFEHKDEILTWTGQPLTAYNDAYYFRKHRWLLKKMFKEHRNG